MSIAEDLRRDADAALREDGMYYSGEYLSGIAERVEEVEAENAKLREQGARLFDKTLELATENAKLRKLVAVIWDVALHPETFGDGSYWLGRMRELGIEVPYGRE